MTCRQALKRSAITVRYSYADSRCRRGRKCGDIALNTVRNRCAWACDVNRTDREWLYLHGLYTVSIETAFETSRTGYPVLGFSQVAASQKFVSEDAVALLRHSA